MSVLGLNAPPLGWHDPAAALVAADGTVLALVEEERVSRVKHGLHRYPGAAVQACLEIAGLNLCDIETIAVGWDLPRQWPRRDRGALDPPLPGRLWTFDDWTEYLDAVLGTRDHDRPDLVFVPHHTAHALSSFHASGWASAAVLVVDGNGDDEAISVFHARAGRPPVRKARLPFSHSLGTLYDVASGRLGLNFLEAGKTMGLAAYGRGTDPVGEMFRLTQDGIEPPFPVASHAEYDDVAACWQMHFDQLGLGAIVCDPFKLDTSDKAIALAWTAQAGIEAAMAHLANWARRLTGEQRLCLAGGVALNCSANGRLPGEVFVPPVPHDAGIALGAAWFAARPCTETLLSPYLGRAASEAEITRAIRKRNLLAQDFCAQRVAERLARGEIGALFTGRAEAGPRALCHRSIVAMPASPAQRDAVNRRKSRETWRPLSPVALAADAGRYWQTSSTLHQYMIGASEVTETCREEAPGVVHVDGSARPQQIEEEKEPVAQLLAALKASGLPPVLINTSFNRRGEPIIDDPSDALDAFLQMQLDFIVFDDKWVVSRHD